MKTQPLVKRKLSSLGDVSRVQDHDLFKLTTTTSLASLVSGRGTKIEGELVFRAGIVSTSFNSGGALPPMTLLGYGLVTTRSQSEIIGWAGGQIRPGERGISPPQKSELTVIPRVDICSPRPTQFSPNLFPSNFPTLDHRSIHIPRSKLHVLRPIIKLVEPLVGIAHQSKIIGWA